MKLAFVLTFFDFRNDIRRVLEVLSVEHTITVFARAGDAEKMKQYVSDKITIEIIHERIHSFSNWFWARIFLLFRKLPASSRNYYLMEAFKVQNQVRKKVRRKGNLILALQKILPKTFTYDRYLDKLRYSSQTCIDGIERFYFLTEIYDDFFLARLLTEQKPVYVYVYSWDHACKHVKFTQRAKYAVWNKEIGEDVHALQNISYDNISVVGASQFGFMDAYYKNRQTIHGSYSFKYIYFACAVGIRSIAQNELEIVKQVAELLRRKFPDLKLVVRPYPLLKDWSPYAGISSMGNVVMDDDFKAADLSVSEAHIYKKYKNIEGALAFLHVGTTLGLEACLLGTPSFVLNFGYASKQDDIYNFIHQYQNEKYLIKPFPETCITSIESLETTLKNITNPAFKKQNERIQHEFPVRSFHTFAQNLLAV